ncbi:hypothetical protein BH23PLA1_BH23PLA1_33700 [soil metagenome]
MGWPIGAGENEVSGLTLSGWVGMGLLAMALQMISVALARALRCYSRSRMEEICEAQGRPDRADEIAHQDDRVERGADGLAAVLTLFLSAWLAWLAASISTFAGPIIAIVLLLGAVGYILADVFGRVLAEPLLDRIWPLAGALRVLSAPLLLPARGLEALARRGAGRNGSIPRPASVEVEIHGTSDDSDEFFDEADLPEATREMLERVVELGRRDVAEVMRPRSGIVALPVSATPDEAARTFTDSGRSRLPIFGESRDDIVGILYAKDLFGSLSSETSSNDELTLRPLVRPAKCIPESKSAADLLEEFRQERVHIAMVLDEYGGVSGLVTLEDLIEEIFGPIDDEHDVPTPEDAVVPIGETVYEVDAAVPLEDLNDRLHLDLPTDGDFLTIGGFAFNALGRLPEPGDSFREQGIEFTVVEVGDHSIRRLRLDFNPSPTVERTAG